MKQLNGIIMLAIYSSCFIRLSNEEDSLCWSKNPSTVFGGRAIQEFSKTKKFLVK
jgi:hypothetical protein